MNQETLTRLIDSHDALMQVNDAQVYLDALASWVDRQVGACHDDIRCRDLLNHFYMLLLPYQDMGVKGKLREVINVIDTEMNRARLMLDSDR